MLRAILPALLGLAAAAPMTLAQGDAPRFRWQAGQTLNYKVEHVTTITEVVGAKKTVIGHKLALLKRWQVQDVDGSGVATLVLSLGAMRNEMTRPDGETIVYDSSAPDKSDPQLRDQLSKYLGVRLAVLRVDARGQVVEVKESKHGPASRYEAEPPFRVALPTAAVAVGESSARDYKVTLEPPQGTGEKFDARQKYTCKSVDGALLSASFATSVSGLPESPADQAPLLQMMPEGEVVFDVKAGVLLRARVNVDREIKGHQGEGSSYRFQSDYREDYTAK